MRSPAHEYVKMDIYDQPVFQMRDTKPSTSPKAKRE